MFVLLYRGVARHFLLELHDSSSALVFGSVPRRKMMERKPRVENAFQQFDPDGFGAQPWDDQSSGGLKLGGSWMNVED